MLNDWKEQIFHRKLKNCCVMQCRFEQIFRLPLPCVLFNWQICDLYHTMPEALVVGALVSGLANVVLDRLISSEFVNLVVGKKLDRKVFNHIFLISYFKIFFKNHLISFPLLVFENQLVFFKMFLKYFT
ncbi:hypothetical protein Ahy_B02g057875 isoform G [Arachis hypogaea]|uniref:Uncharacterized protein n=1 Tax=Arachis hypogaea TaxID=3818 RepID=A0A445AD65_ARAHY|nr:hypothetical protein Ahy_B02g057875 isoform G [Arachis hypogaea]